MGAEFEAGALFTNATTTFELSTGYSFSSGYEKSKGIDVTESFSVETVASPGTKMITQFYKSEAPVEVKWRVNNFASSYVLRDDEILSDCSLTMRENFWHLGQLIMDKER